MKKEIAIQLKAAAEETARRCSNLNRPGNINKETFTVSKILPLSEHVAAVIFDKSSRKKALACFYLQPAWNNGRGDWQHFFPTDSHLLGFSELSRLKLEIEKYNFAYNFGDEQ